MSFLGYVEILSSSYIINLDDFSGYEVKLRIAEITFAQAQPYLSHLHGINH